MIRLPDGSRATHHDIAEIAGVGVATVDRVLNQRGGVGAAKEEAVLRAAKELGFDRRLPEITNRIEILLPANPTPFWGMMSEAFERFTKELPGHYEVSCKHYPENNLPALKDAILGSRQSRRALIVAPDAAEEVLPYLKEAMIRGERVVTLTTEVPGLSNHVHSGIDNVKAGRTAAHLMKGWIHRPGRILLLVSQSRRAEHRQRVQGFCDAIGSAFDIETYWTEQNLLPQADIVQRALEVGDIVGIYDASHDEPAMGDVIRNAGTKPVWIGHECSEFHVRMCQEGLMDFILDQDAELQAGFALHAATLDDEEVRANHSRPPKPARLRIFCRENLA